MATTRPIPSRCQLEALPAEILSRIMSYITLPSQKPSLRVPMPEPINTKTPIEHLSLLPTLQTSKRLHEIAIAFAYRSPVLRTTTAFEHFTHQIIQTPSLGQFVRKLDLSYLTTSANFNSNSNTNSAAEKSTNSLQHLLQRTPLIRELTIGQTLEHFVDAAVLRLIFCDLPFLEVLDLNACNSVFLDAGFTALAEDNTSITPTIRTLHLRNYIPSSPDSTAFTHILSQLTSLQNLDVSHTTIPITALTSIPTTARLQHLDISFCPSLSSTSIAGFISTHPSVTSTLTSLNATQHHLDPAYLDADSTSAILSSLPSTITSLDLSQAAFLSSHVPTLHKFRRSLEFLAVGSVVKVGDLERLVLGEGRDYPISTSFPETNGGDDDPMGPLLGVDVKPKYTPVLGPLGVAIPVCKLKRRINLITSKKETGNGNVKLADGGESKLKHLNITSMTMSEQVKIMESVLLSKEAMPLEVIELAEETMRWQEGLVGSVVEKVGWRERCVGKRYWIERV